MFLFLLAVQLPDIPSYYFTDDESQYQVDSDDDFDDLEIDVVTDLGRFIVLRIVWILLIIGCGYNNMFHGSLQSLQLFDLSGQSKPEVDDLEAELEADLDNLKLDDIDTTDVNLDDEELLED